MYEKAKAECDKCGNDVTLCGELYCDECYQKSLEENKELIKRINGLEKRIKKLTRGGTQ